ncbi:MAG: hypothetical protein P4L84_33685, partial [Isosphaeraceae bacterium]|nr:hypothetical protein [Isosphaeraceae bacterium]
HNKWWPVGKNVLTSPGVATSLAADTYELQITGTDPGNVVNATDPTKSTQTQNNFSIGVVDAGATPGTVQVYGNGTMCNWYNVSGTSTGPGTSTFYLAQIPAKYAGKTIQINLFDPGDSYQATYIKVVSPDKNTQTEVGFAWTAATLEGAAVSSGTVVAGSSGLPATTSSGTKVFNDLMVTISIPLGASYGSTATGGLWNNGWWQIQYIANSANDTTTWGVDVAGTPVHLTMP